MPRFAANLSHLFVERPYRDRFAAAATAGFRGVEVLFPYDEIEATLNGIEQQDLHLVLVNAPLPDRAAGHLGLASTPGAEGVFRAEMRGLFALWDRLKPGLVHVMSGNGDGPAAIDTFVGNLRWLLAEVPGQRFSIEPLNPRDRPDYLLQSYDLASDVLDLVEDDRIGLQYDTYHAALIEGDALDVWRRHRHRVVHVQIGNPPDRGPPGPGPVDFPHFFAELDASGYPGWVSAEYSPGGPTEQTLGWLPDR